MNSLHGIQKKARLCVFISKLKNVFIGFILLAYVALLSPAQSKREFTFENGQLAHVMEANGSCELAFQSPRLERRPEHTIFPSPVQACLYYHR